VQFVRFRLCSVSLFGFGYDGNLPFLKTKRKRHQRLALKIERRNVPAFQAEQCLRQNDFGTSLGSWQPGLIPALSYLYYTAI
jgi:hypothetical protein